MSGGSPPVGRDVASRVTADGYFVLRAPAYPVGGLAAWEREAGADPDEAVRRLRLRQALMQYFHDSPSLREALAFASPDTVAALDGYQRGDLRAEKQARKLERTLGKYFSRAHGRATPFGLFAGTALGSFAERTDLQLASAPAHGSVARLDYSVLASIVNWLSAQDAVRKASRYRVNSSLYVCAGEVRYVERKGATTRDISYELSGAVLSGAVAEVLAAAERPMAWTELAAMLYCEEEGMGAVEAFLHDLIDSQLLVNELELPVTGDDPLAGVITQLRALGVAPDVVDALERVTGILRDMSHPQARIAEHLAQLQHELTAVGAPTFTRNVVYLQLQLSSPAPLTLHRGVQEEIGAAVRALATMRNVQRSGTTGKPDDELKAFRLAFQRRYDDAMVPLTTALDGENGIGFAGPWTASAVDRTPTPRAAESPAGRWEAFLAERLGALSAREGGELVLAPSDFEYLDPREPLALLESMQVFGRLAATSATAIDDGQFLVHIQQCSGPTEASLSARFAVGNAAMTARLRASTRARERADGRVLAEIVHLPGNRAGNVVQRPVLSDYEIPFLARAGVDDAHQLDIRDLHLFVEARRLVLWSERLGREVLPRLSCAHAALPVSQLPMYRFLYSLHMQQRQCLLRWDWGRLGANGWLPRVRVGRSVLALAQWRLGPETVRRLQAASCTDQGGLLRELQARVALPRFVSVDDNGEPLPLDLRNELTRDIFVERLNADTGSTVTEVFPDPSACALSSPDGTHMFELVVPVHVAAARSERPTPRSSTRITHAPGGEWLSFKVYCGQLTVDRILRDVVAPFVHRARSAAQIARWFFVRYADPDYHLRIRMEGDRHTLWRDVLPALHDAMRPLVEAGAVYQTVVDSYRPEVARYGGSRGLTFAHDVFTADSEAALATLLHMPDAADATDRLLLSLAGVRGYYEAFAPLGLDPARGLRAARDQLASSVWAASKDAETGKRDASAAYRRQRPAIEAILTNPHVTHLAAPMGHVMRRDEELARIARRMHPLVEAQALSQPAGSLLASFAHMHVNRVTQDWTSQTEWRIYDALVLHYQSAQARRQGVDAPVHAAQHV